jgi:hypothetical protein
MRRSVASRSTGRGFARVEPDAGTLVVYAAAAGQTAADGDETNSPFATALIHRLVQPGLEVRRLFDSVRDDVMDATGNTQQPFAYGSLSGKEDFYFLKPDTTPAMADRIPAFDAESSARADFALARQVGTVAAWDSFLATHPNGFLGDLAKGERAKLTSASISTDPPVRTSSPVAAISLVPSQVSRPAIGAAEKPRYRIRLTPIRPSSAPTITSPRPKLQLTRQAPSKSTKCFMFNGERVCE